MQFSRNWICEHVDWGASDALPEVDDLAHRLTQAGHAVEGEETVEGHDGGKDVVLDFDITTNRPDCMNHLGLARELSVLYGRPLRPLELPEVEVLAGNGDAEQALAYIDDPQLCRRYVGLIVRGVKVGPSPDWLVEKLQAVGVRSINNVVDVTNYVLWELGQPSHAYDLERVHDRTLRVRRASGGEKLVTLDGETRELTEDMLVIADGAECVGLAGVMGGLDSEVTNNTRDILLECAWFDPISVRRTARVLGMHTDASHRFERGADLELCARAARRGAQLILQLAGGELGPMVDVYPRPFEPRTLDLRLDRLEAFAGIEYGQDNVETWLTGLGCRLEDQDAQNGPAWRVTVPSWRHHDMEETADVYEEVIRVHGFDAIEPTLPRLRGTDGHTPVEHLRAMAVRRHLAACGYAEVINYAFHDEAADRSYPGLYADHQPLYLSNPLSERYALMRRSLLPGLIESARFNQRRGAEAVCLFEIGHVFAQGHETEALAMLAGGQPGTPWQGSRQLDFFDLKGALDSIAEAMGVTLDAESVTDGEDGATSALVPGCRAVLRLRAQGTDGAVVGYCGQLHLEDIPFPLFVAELETQAFATEDASLEVEVPSRFPSVHADFTLTHARTLPWTEIEAAIRELAPADLLGFHLQDRYQGKGVPDGAVNTTVHFLYNSPAGSLTQDEVNERQQGLTDELGRRFGWSS